MRHSDRIHLREKGNSFYQNPAIQLKKQSAQQVRVFKDKAQEQKKVMEGITMREIKRIQRGGLVPQLEDILAIGSSPPGQTRRFLVKKSSRKLIDPEQSKFEEVLSQTLKEMEDTKRQTFGKETQPKESEEFYFQRLDYMQHNKEYKDAMYEFEHKPISEKELQSNVLESVNSSMLDKHSSLV